MDSAPSRFMYTVETRSSPLFGFSSIDPPAGGLMYAVESGAYMFFGFLSMVFPCVYMGISIATVRLLVYG